MDNSANLARVPGVGETRLSDELLARLPENRIPAPWPCRCQAVFWFGRAGSAASTAANSRGLAVMGGLVHYLDTPVGSYYEVFGAIGVRRGRAIRGTVPFIAVDSPESLVGGRVNWSLPKTLARFDGSLASGVLRAEGDDGQRWSVAARHTAYGPAFPSSSTMTFAQPSADGVERTSVMKTKGKGRLARVHVDVESGGDLAGWLRPGWHAGMFIEDMSFELSPPR